jgi:hypothetical protein
LTALWAARCLLGTWKLIQIKLGSSHRDGGSWGEHGFPQAAGGFGTHSHAELSNGCPKNIHRVVHSLCALIVGRAIEMSAFIRAKPASLQPVLVIRAVPVMLIPTGPAA